MTRWELPCGHSFVGGEIDDALEQLILYHMSKDKMSPESAHKMAEARLMGAYVRIVNKQIKTISKK